MFCDRLSCLAGSIRCVIGPGAKYSSNINNFFAALFVVEQDPIEQKQCIHTLDYVVVPR